MVTTEYRLGELCKLRNGYAFKSGDYVKDGTPVIRISNIKENESSTKDAKRVNSSDKFNDYIINKGDILIAMSGATTGKFGRYISEEVAYQNQRVGCFIIKDKKKLNQDFLYLLLKQLKPKIEADAYGGGQPNISSKTIEQYKVEIPFLDDQKRISSILEKTDFLINQRKESIELADELLKHTFLTMFENGNYETDTLENLVHENCPLTYGIVQPGEEVNSGLPVVRPVDQSNEYIGLEGLKLIDPTISEKFSRTILKGGEILLCVRGTTGLLSIAKHELKGANVTRGITPIWFSEEFNTQFAYHLLKSERVQRVIQEKTYGATLKQINLRDVRLIQLIKPSMELQERFAEIAQGVYDLKNYLQQSLDELNELYHSLSHKSFNGELTIIGKIEIEGSLDFSDSNLIVAGSMQPHEDFIPDESTRENEFTGSSIEIVKVLTKAPKLLKNELHLKRLIRTKIIKTYFTFEDLQNTLTNDNFNLKFEDLKELVFNLIRQKKLLQIFADAFYKSGFTSSDPDYEEVKSLKEKIYFKRVL